METAAQKMLRFSITMSHPDGQLPFFNDSAFDIAPTSAQLVKYASYLNIPLKLSRNAINLIYQIGLPRGKN